MKKIWETSDFKEIYDVNTTNFVQGSPCLRVHSFCHSKSSRGWIHSAGIKQQGIIAFLILSGNQQIIGGNRGKEILKEGYFFMGNLNNLAQKLRTLSAEAERYFVLFEVNTFLTSMLENMFPDGMPNFYSPAPEKLKTFFENIRNCIVEDAEDPRISGAAYSLFHEVMNQLPANKLPLSVRLANDYIAGNFSRPSLSREEIARYAMVSVSTLAALYRKHLNMTIWESIARRRMEAVTQFLKFSNKSVGDIALLCGFSYAYYLTREFKSRFGCTPTEYRRSHCRSIQK